MKFDQADKKIISILQENARISNTGLAAEIGISASPTLERVKKLEKQGVIRKYVALLAPEKVGKGTIALVSVSLAVHEMGSLDHFLAEIRKLPEVTECYHITGESDFLMKVIVDDIEAYRDFVLNKLTRIGGISRIRTSIVLDTVKYTTKIEVE